MPSPYYLCAAPLVGVVPRLGWEGFRHTLQVGRICAVDVGGRRAGRLPRWGPSAAGGTRRSRTLTWLPDARKCWCPTMLQGSIC